MSEISIHCKTAEEWGVVTKKSGLEWNLEDSNWGVCQEESVIFIESCLKFASVEWAKGAYYEIISAEQYLGKQIISATIGCTEKSKPTIMKKLTTKLKRLFNNDQRQLYKAGLMDGCGDLTAEGSEELNELVLEDHMKELVEKADEIIEEKNG